MGVVHALNPNTQGGRARQISGSSRTSRAMFLNLSPTWMPPRGGREGRKKKQETVTKAGPGWYAGDKDKSFRSFEGGTPSGDGPTTVLTRVGWESQGLETGVQKFHAAGFVGGEVGKPEAVTYRAGVQALTTGDPATMWCKVSTGSHLTHSGVTCFLCPGLYAKFT